MASCSLGASNVNVPSLNLGNGRAGNLQPRGDVRNWMGMKPQPYPSLAISCPTEKASRVSCGPSSETGAVISVRNGVEETKSSDLTSKLIPNSSEVESLVSEICDSTSIAEFELNLKGFRLHLIRNLASNTEPPLPPPLSPAPVSVSSASDATASNGSASSTSLAISKLVSSSGRAQTFLEKTADEGFTILQSPKVGFFRRSRTIKGKRAPPPCKEKQEVKEGQVLCYIEQLGGEIPIESDISGEIIKILKNDGDPVGYGDALIAILPSFPGIKKLQ